MKHISSCENKVWRDNLIHTGKSRNKLDFWRVSIRMLSRSTRAHNGTRTILASSFDRHSWGGCLRNPPWIAVTRIVEALVRGNELLFRCRFIQDKTFRFYKLTTFSLSNSFTLSRSHDFLRKHGHLVWELEHESKLLTQTRRHTNWCKQT